MSRKQKLGSVFLSIVILLFGVFIFTTPSSALALTANDYRQPSSIVTFGPGAHLIHVSEVEAIYANNTSQRSFDFGVDRQYAITDMAGNFLIFQKGSSDDITTPTRDASHDLFLGVITPNHRYTGLNTPILNSNPEAIKAAVNSTPGVTGDLWTAAMSLNNSRDAILIQNAAVRQLQQDLARENAIRDQQIANRQDTTAIDSQIAATEAGLATADTQLHSNANANQLGYNKANGTGVRPIWCMENNSSGFFKFPRIDINPPGCLAMAGEQLLKGSSWLLWITAYLFDYTIDYTLNFRNIIDSIPMVETGWRILRDVTNIFFIFILLVISIGIIVDKSQIGSKSMIAGVIIAAVLINFSLFFTKVIIDGSNILALQFYSEIRGTPYETTPSSPNGKRGGLTPGIAGAFVNGLQLSTIYSDGGDSAQNPVAGAASLGARNLGASFDPWNVVIITFGGSVLILVTSFVFLSGIVMFTMRTITLIFLMILSPIAFMAQALPNPTLRSGAKKWWDMLFKECLFAPVYMLMTYVVVSAINSPTYLSGANSLKKGGGQLGNFASLFAGDTTKTGTAFTFILIIGFMISTLVIAKSLGAKGAGGAISIGKNIANGTKNWVVRNTAGTVVGQVGSRLANSGILNAAAGNAFFRTLGAGAVLRSANNLTKTKIGGQSYADRVKAKQDNITDTAKLVNDRTVRRGILESNDDYNARVKRVATVNKERINSINGVDEKGNAVGFRGLTYSGRQAILRNQNKLGKSASKEKDLETLRQKSTEKLGKLADKIKVETEDEFNQRNQGKNLKYSGAEAVKIAQEKLEAEIKTAQRGSYGDGKDKVGGSIGDIIDELHHLEKELEHGLNVKLDANGKEISRVALTEDTRLLKVAQVNIKTADLQKEIARAEAEHDKQSLSYKKEEENEVAGALKEFAKSQGKKDK